MPLIYVNNGENLGEALYQTELNFPDKEVVGDLQIYAELDNFQVALDQLANDWLDDSIRQIEQKAAVLNGFAILLIAAIVAWVVMGTFDMQDQLVSGMGWERKKLVFLCFAFKNIEQKKGKNCVPIKQRHLLSI